MSTILTKITIGIKAVCLFENWLQVGLTYLGLSESAEPIYTLRNGIKYKVPQVGDWGVIYEIWSDKLWTPPGYEIQSGYTVVDIGAHVGIFSIRAASCVSNVKVFSYEPHPRNFELLKDNIKLNGLKNINPFPMAVGGDSGKRRLFISENAQGHSMIQPQENYIEVNCITLKEIIDQVGKCDFLKINCEGAEYEILLNAPKDCLRKVLNMAIDCHVISGYTVYDLRACLEKEGFQVALVQPASAAHIHLYARSENRLGV